MTHHRLLALLLAGLVWITACSNEAPPTDEQAALPDITATNAFYYYADVEAAWDFYRDTLGLETVVEYGFAKIMRLAESSYVTLVAAESGMHSAAEPKTVTLTLLTEQLDGWKAHLRSSGVAVLSTAGDHPEPNFVVLDPEGYTLRFELSDAHAHSASFVAAAAGLDIRAVIYSIYLRELKTSGEFYEGLLGVESVVETGWGRLYPVAGSGFLGLVDDSDELHQATEENGVTLSFLTSDIDAWFERAVGWPGFELRTPEILNEGGLVRVFVGYGPEGYFLEWDTFLEVDENASLLRYLP